MNSLVKVLGNFKEYCQAINRATSTGAIDVIVVEQPDGEFLCSTFHVCFSMLGVLNSREKNVDIEVNGMPISLQMRLSDTGEACFLEKHLHEIGNKIYTGNGSHQTIEHNMNFFELLERKDKNKFGSSQSLNLYGHNLVTAKMTRSKSCSVDNTHLLGCESAEVGLRRSLSLQRIPSRNFSIKQSTASENFPQYNKRNFLSDSDLYEQREDEPYRRRVLSEGDLSKLSPKIKWDVKPSTLAENNVKSSNKAEEILEQLSSPDKVIASEDSVAPLKCSLETEGSSLNLNSSVTEQSTTDESENLEIKSKDESQLGLSFNLNLDGELCSLTDTEDNLLQLNRDYVALSLCGTDEPTDAEFQEHQLTYSMLCDNPQLFASSKLIVRLDNKYYPYPVAAAHIMSMVVFKQILPDSVLETYKKFHKEEQNKKKLVISSPTESDVEGVDVKRSWWHWKSKSTTPRIQSPTEVSPKASPNTLSPPREAEVSEKVAEQSPQKEKQRNSEKAVDAKPKREEKKTFKLPSDIIKKLNLKMGKNTIEFSVTTAFQGTTRCQCALYRWKYNDKIIVSDIDGTITKSDVLGHLLPMVGKDWSQLGVAQLFTKIVDNGYKLLYVSSRAIGQAKNTREYLNWVRQDNTTLPEGPILISPTSMLNALHRELIERKPELFKIACLEDISSLFPYKNPFYAGYGNRINDVVAYCHVGIPKARIFTINYRGEISFEQIPSLRSSYLNMAEIVDHIFPPVNSNDECDSHEFFGFNYWREPIYQLPIEVLDSNVIESPTSKHSFRLRF